jgi:hypothetical protein
LSRILRATETALSSGAAVMTPGVMISRSLTLRTLQAMSELQRTPVVPLEAGAGPANPPCPAGGAPLWGGPPPRPGLDGPASRCESCGLAVIGAAGEPDAALRALDELRRDGGFALDNRASFSAWIGAAGWAGLQPGARYAFTVEAARRLLARRDQVVASVRWRPARGLALMWQTVLNGFTFGHNVALGALGRAGATPATSAWQRWLDGGISVLAAIPALLAALPLELGAAAFRRGGAVALSAELL